MAPRSLLSAGLAALAAALSAAHLVTGPVRYSPPAVAQIGDGYLAAWGASRSPPDASTRMAPPSARW